MSRNKRESASLSAHFELIQHTLCGVPVPRMLWPRIETRESAADGAYTFLAEARTFAARISCATEAGSGVNRSRR